jgi:hypothetical protein
MSTLHTNMQRTVAVTLQSSPEQKLYLKTEIFRSGWLRKKNH